MRSPQPSIDVQKRLVQQWRETGRLLAELRRAEMIAQSAQESGQTAYDLLQLGGMLPLDPAREKMSGMVEMQRLFGRARGRSFA